MSHWGIYYALNVIILFIYFITKVKYPIKIQCTSRKDIINIKDVWPFKDSQIIEIIYGTLLGDGYAEKRKNGKGTRISFYQENSHDDYLLYLHSLVANLGYCNTNIPQIKTRLGKHGKLRKVIRFHTWTYDQFNYIHELWYKDGIKILPSNLDTYLSPLALAIWIMDDGGKAGKGLKISINNFTILEINNLVNLLDNKYKIKANIHKVGTDNQWNIYIPSESMNILTNLIKPYIIPSMKYKFGDYINNK